MKRLIASASLAAVAAAGIQTACAQGLSNTGESKPWSVSATLRGFYDDNYLTTKNSQAQDSFGFEIRPNVSLRYPMEQTLATLNYTYGLKYYEDRDSDNYDQTHVFDAGLDHKFTENFKLSLNNSFVVSQEPEFLYTSQAVQKKRLSKDAMRDVASIFLDAMFTDQFGIQTGYTFSWYDYDDAVYSWLNRYENLCFLDFRWRLVPELTALFGYQFGIINYTSDVMQGTVKADVRDQMSHYIYLGADYNMTSKLLAGIRVGAQFADWYNVGDYNVNLDDSSITPYVDARLTYTYLRDSYLQLGFKHSRVPTDMNALDQEATSVFAVVNHKIAGGLTGRLIAQYQLGSFYQYVNAANQASNEYSDNYWTLGLNLTYQFNKYLAGEVGYNLDRLDSDSALATGAFGGSYTRNRVYLGVRASY